MSDLISIDKLVKRYGSVVALGGVSLNIRRGEFLSILGPSGCGKTTLLRAIAGFVEPTSGEIRIDGQLMNDVPPNRRPVNTVFQNYALFPHMTVAENVAFGPRRAGMARGEITRRIAEVLLAVGMDGYGDRYPRALSGGQQQRIALARALINQPQVLLLDEPLGALDLKLRKRMQLELKRLHQDFALTFVYVTHDQEEALAMSDRIAVMKQGEIVQLGNGQEIYRNPASRYVADFIGEANLIDCVLDGGSGVRLAHGSLVLPYSCSGSDAATLMVRPEDIHLGDAPGDAAIVVVPATVRNKTFIGQGWRLVIALDTGHVISAQPPASAAIEQLIPGDRVTAWWPSERGRLLTR